MKKKTFSACIMAALLTASITNTQATAGILAEGNISVYKDGNLSNTIKGQSPIDEKSLLVCNENCMIKSTGISIVGKTGTELAVKGDQKQFNLLLKKGQLDFILSGAIGKIGFYTADRQYTSADVIYNASSTSPVRGYMQVTPEGNTKIGIYEGRLVFDTVEGAKTIDSNNYILLAQAGVGNTRDTRDTRDNIESRQGFFSGIGTPEIIAGSSVALVTAWGLTQYIDSANDDDDTPASPNL
ncbi:FecR family protein [Candidatus Electrothrix laxa]